MLTKKIPVGQNTAQGIEITLPNAKLILVKGTKGFLMCGYLNILLAEKLGDCAAIVRGVNSIDELLSGRVVEVTSTAMKAGIKIGMKGSKALEKMF